jgi:hypothetical protein
LENRTLLAGRPLSLCLEADAALRRLRSRFEKALDIAINLLNMGSVFVLGAFNVLQLSRQVFVSREIFRRRMNARMIRMFNATARLLDRTEESIATPCSVKA